MTKAEQRERVIKGRYEDIFRALRMMRICGRRARVEREDGVIVAEMPERGMSVKLSDTFRYQFRIGYAGES